MTEAADQLTAWQILAHYDQIAEDKSASLSRAKSSGEYVRGLQCKVGSYNFVVPQHALQEVLPLPATTTVPGGPAWLLGLANRYGQLLPIVDAYGFVTGKASKTAIRSLLVIGTGDNAVGLAIANIGQPIGAHTTPKAPAQISKSASMPSSFTPLLQCWAALGDTWQAVLDVEKLQHSINQWQN